MAQLKQATQHKPKLVEMYIDIETIRRHEFTHMSLINKKIIDDIKNNNLTNKDKGVKLEQDSDNV